MSELLLRRAHQLPDAELKARVARVAGKLSERFGAACRWHGNVLLIEHASVTGSVTLTTSEVVVAARLGRTARLFRRRAEHEIARILDRELES